jgi:NAD+--asparagine ADP-ribosyltransferase
MTQKIISLRPVNYPNEINLSKNVIDKTINSVKKIMLFTKIVEIRDKYNINQPLLKGILS